MCVAGRGATLEAATAAARLIAIPDTGGPCQTAAPLLPVAKRERGETACVAPLPSLAFGARRPPLGQGEVRICGIRARRYTAPTILGGLPWSASLRRLRNAA